MKKGVATSTIVSVVIAVLGLVIIMLLVLPLIMNIARGDKEICKVNVLHTSQGLRKAFAVECVPDYVNISSDALPEEVYEAFANQIARAWYISGRGELKPFENSKNNDNICLITAKIHFENQDYRCNEADCEGLFEYIKEHNYEGIEGKFSYVDYLNFSYGEELSVKLTTTDSLPKKRLGFQNFYYHDDKEEGVLEKITPETKIDPSVIDYYVIILRDDDFKFDKGYRHSIVVLPVKYMGEVCTYVLN